MLFSGMTLHEDLLKCIPIVSERHLYRDSSVTEIIHSLSPLFEEFHCGGFLHCMYHNFEWLYTCKTCLKLTYTSKISPKLMHAFIFIFIYSSSCLDHFHQSYSTQTIFTSSCSPFSSHSSNAKVYKLFFNSCLENINN